MKAQKRKELSDMKTNVTTYMNLDSAGIIYPYAANGDWCSVYRVEAKMKSPVSVSALRLAVGDMIKEHPYYFSKIAEYKNNYVLVPAKDTDVIYKNTENICRPFKITQEPLTRIIYGKNIIAAELFHCLADGRGGLAFFKELLKKYARYKNGGKITDIRRDSYLSGNLTDIYVRMTLAGGKSESRLTTHAYQLKSVAVPNTDIVCIDADMQKLKEAAKNRNATVSQYLCALQMKAIFDSEKTGSKTVRLSVPVDIRKFALGTTDRNGSLYALISAKKKDAASVDTLISTVKKQFATEITAEKMRNIAYANVKQGNMKLFRMLPIGVKKKILNFGYTFLGEDQFTSTFTNPGIIELDAELRGETEDIYFILGRQKTKPVNIAVSTYGNSAKLMVTSDYRCPAFTGWIEAYLRSDGVPFTVKRITPDCNDGDETKAVNHDSITDIAS